MKSIVVFDSFFGNTAHIAASIAEEIPGAIHLHAEQTDAERLSAFEMIIMGCPTRSFQASKPTKELIRSFSIEVFQGKLFAAFDTRIHLDAIQNKLSRKLVHAGGYAAPILQKRMIKKGMKALSLPMGFYVQDTEGPLKTGEIARAAEWGRSLYVKALEAHYES